MPSFLRNLREKHDLKTLIFYSSWALTITSGMSYFFGMLRDRAFAHTFGLSKTLDIYNAAFTLPEMLYNVLILSVLSAGFVPIFTQKYDEHKQAGYRYAHQMMSWGVAIVVLGSVLSIIFLPYFSHLLVDYKGTDLQEYIKVTRLMLLSPLIFAISSIYGQVLLSLKEFFWYGLSPVFYNLGIIVGVSYLYPHFGVMGMVVGTLFGALLHLLNRMWAVKKRKFKFKIKPDFKLTPEMKETFKLAYPKIPQYILAQLMLAQFTKIATSLPEGSVTAYNYGRNFQSLPVSLIGIAIALAMFSTLSHDAGKGNFEKFKADFKKNRFRALFYTTLGAIALALLSKIIISVVLGGGEFGEKDIQLVTGVLMVYCISVPLESMMYIYHRAFYALRNTLIPALMHAFTIGLTIFAAFMLAPHIGIYCIPVSFAAGLALHIAVLASVFPLLLKRREAAVHHEAKNLEGQE